MLYIKLACALLLVALNGFFVLAEFAIVKVRRTKLEEYANQGSNPAKIALKISHHLDSYLSAIQLGITLASLALGWLGEPAVVGFLKPILEMFTFNIAPNVLSTFSVILSFSIITLLHVVLGELIPKSLAIQKSDYMALVVAWPLFIFHKLVYPLVYIFDVIAAFGLRVLGLQPGGEHEQTHSEEELRMIVNASYNEGILTDTEGVMLDNVFTFSDKRVHEIMVPRTDMVCLYKNLSYDENIKIMVKSVYTRFPICGEDKDVVLGIIHLRDVMENNTSDGKPARELEHLVREALFVPENLKLSAVLHLMRKRRIHLAIIVDEYGGTAGLVSLEDILEEIVGDIQDEYDGEGENILKVDENRYEINGKVLLSDMEKFFNIDFGDQDDETVGGLVFSLLGRVPIVGDSLVYMGHKFEVKSMDNLRIDKLEFYTISEENQN